MSNSSELTWFGIARRPRYLAGLALAILSAIVFALLANWQFSRTLTPIPDPPSAFDKVALSDLIVPGGRLAAELINRPVVVPASVAWDQVFIVKNRRQLASDDSLLSGYWIVANSVVQLSAPSENESASLTLALFFTENLETALETRNRLGDLIKSGYWVAELSGVLGAPEGPRPISSAPLESLSLAQLVNLYSDEPLRSYPAFLIVDEQSALELGRGLEDRGVALPADVKPIEIAYLDEAFEINWLTAFYALEWLIFAIIAFYVWWRLVSDALVRERNE